MALHRGIQSAIFYYLSCAPCTGYSYRKKRRKEATRDRASKHQLEMDQPGLYRHPSPFATNPHWQTEIDLGPAPPATRRKKENQKKSARNRTSGVIESNVASSVSLSLAPGESNDSTWNLRRYQREDEDLWGPNLAPRMSRASNMESARGTISRPATARTATTDQSYRSYYSANHPEINDMHPAIVTRIDTREDALWMLQPPPPARVMNGDQKPRITRTRADSASSRLSSRRSDYAPLPRQLSKRIVDDKIKNGEQLPAISLSRAESNRLSKHSQRLGKRQGQGHRHDRDLDSDLASSTENLSLDGSLISRRRRRQAPINVRDASNDSEKTMLHQPLTPNKYAADFSSNRTPHNRRSLSPMALENAKPKRSARGYSALEHLGDQSPKTTRGDQDASLNVLQELDPISILNVQRLQKSPSFEARIQLPSSDTATEEMDLLGSGKAAFESWYEGRDHSQFPQWVSERTRRDVTARWSVDF